MRNLKRALSLLLSSTLVLGMLVMGGSAAGYKDVDASNDHQEAIEVLQAVGIMTGDQNGNFNPDGSITRNEMAVIMAHLLNLDYDYYRGTNPFTDVPEWAAPYVAACAAEGVVAGIGNGQFGGDQKVTAAQASLMLMKALGYFQNAEDFGTDWQVATIRQASYINLFANINATAESALTRAQVAQLVLNGLKAKKVDFTGDKGIQIGDVTVGYRAEYTPLTSAAAKYNTIDDGTTNIAENDQYYIQLGEELYNGDLTLDNGSDAFGRPARIWEYDGNEIGVYAKVELLQESYTTEVTGKELYNELGSAVLSNYSLNVYIDGVENNGELSKITRTNTNTFGSTGNGVLTEVYVDTTAKEATIAIINTYFAKAVNDYTDKREYATLEVWGIDKLSNGDYVKQAGSVSGTSKNLDIYGEDFAAAKDIKVDDIFLVTVAQGEIQSIADPEIVAKTTINSFKKANWVVSEGTTYNYSDSVTYKKDVLDAYDDNNMKETTYNLYLDQYGYMIGIEIVDSQDNYVFITGYEKFGSVLTNAKAEARAIFTDGTVENITVKDAAITKDKAGSDWNANGNANENGWYTYAVDKNGNYELTPVATAIATGVKVAQGQDNRDGQEINKSHVSLDMDKTAGSKYVYGNDDTIYLGVKLNDAETQITGVKTVVTGVKNANMKLDVNSTEPDGAYALYNDKGYIIAAVVVGQNMAASENYAYIIGDVQQEDYDAEADEYTWYRKAIVNGEEVVLREKGSSLKVIGGTGKGNMAIDTWYEVEYDADGYVIGKSAIDWDIISALDGDTYATASVQGFNTVKTGYDKEDVVLVKQDMDKTDFSLVLDGLTVYVRDDKTIDSGIAIVPGAKVVLIDNWDDSGREIEYFDNADGNNNVKAALDEMVSTKFQGNVYFVMKDGVATNIIINDTETHSSGNSPITPNGKYQLANVIQDGTALGLHLNNAVVAGDTVTAKVYVSALGSNSFSYAGDATFTAGSIGAYVTRGGNYVQLTAGATYSVYAELTVNGKTATTDTFTLTI